MQPGDRKYRDAQLSVELAQKALVLSPYDHQAYTLSEAYYVVETTKKRIELYSSCKTLHKQEQNVERHGRYL